MLSYFLGMIDLGTLVVFLISLLAVWGYMKSRPPKGLPPGPKPLPFIGNLNILASHPHAHLVLNKLGQKYGAIYSLQLGWYPAVVITDYSLMKEALLKQAELCENRFTHMIFVKMMPSYALGVLNADGRVWKMSRKLVIGQLRTFGMGRPSVEPRIMSEIEPMLQQIFKQRGEAFDIVDIFTASFTNIISGLLFNKGERYEYTDPDFKDIFTQMRLFMKAPNMNYDYPIMVPYLMPLMFFNSNSMSLMKSMGKLEARVRTLLKTPRPDFDPEQIRDYIDLYWKGKGENRTEVEYSEENFVRLIMDLLAAGPDTTIKTLSWVILFLLREPQIQEQCRKDVLNVVGTDRLPSLSDRSSLPYIEATICEAQRLGNTAPLSVMHATASDVTLNGYHIPPQTLLIPDTYSVHMNPELWADPDKFDPERFLDGEGKLTKPPYFMPFCIGTRACPGDTLAKEELFLFLTSLLQRFELTTPGDQQELPDSYDGIYGITLGPAPFQVVANPVNTP